MWRPSPRPPSCGSSSMSPEACSLAALCASRSFEWPCHCPDDMHCRPALLPAEF
ncbi:hypothetical protein PR003_g18111 [Phytophthora rubi]|uniref:Uncharacterized protein n=1 Tax=Phytophthora rubi TaxID=129364 RepID=A0A6A4E990_9STRA|nr:hypothetical protein PR002_g23050 [Phytophthora rubi]KAE9318942.1 hypothetical protein PR003_g18111 [Phytophthora rubi]